MIYAQLYIMLILAFLLVFTILRGVLSTIVDYILNSSSRKKRRKGQTIKEWLLYSKYRDIIPNKFLVIYLSLFIYLFVQLLALTIILLLGLNYNSARIITSITLIPHFILSFIILIMFHDSKSPNKINVARRVCKKHGNKKQK